ncbi:MAG: double zinc ribbon domain-containing protein [Pirellulales bacterium]|nr:double zinc ribbon domain-containing protein [Pirellulales bacterium]
MLALLKTGASWLGAIGRGAQELLFPLTCIACRAELMPSSAHRGFCEECVNDLPLVRWPVCQRCAARVPELPKNVASCSRCERGTLAFDRVICLGSYDGLLRDLVLRMKKDRGELLASALGGLVHSHLSETLRSLPLDGIVPIPMPFWRRMVRGTNPPAALATVLSRQLAVPAFTGLLKKSPKASPQLGLSRAGRFRNIQGQISADAGYSLEDAHLLLVDDVLTTGATCSEAAKVLKRCGASKVTVLVIGRTPNY